MGIKAAEPLDIAQDELKPYLHAKHSVYMETGGDLFYITDCNDIYWRVQRTDQLNEKKHYIDCSELIPTLSEFLDLPFGDPAASINDRFEEAVFYASEKPAPAE